MWPYILICHNLHSFSFFARAPSRLGKILRILDNIPALTHTDTVAKKEKKWDTLPARRSVDINTHTSVCTWTLTHAHRCYNHTHTHIYIYVYTFMQTYTTHLENWLLSLLSGDTCYLFCAHPTTKTSMTCFLRFIFTQKKPVKFLKRPQQMPNVIVCLDEVVWLVSGASLW